MADTSTNTRTSDDQAGGAAVAAGGAADPARMYDVVVVGGGPAGLTAALYLARARYRVVVVEREHFGGQITITSEVVNYPGVGRTSGSALTETMRRQAEAFGAEFLSAEVTGLDMGGDVKVVYTASRGDLSCFGVLLATGARPRMVGFSGEEQFRGHGVAYCATCDGEFFTGKDVFVVGGGFAAAEESVFLTNYARHVTVLIRRDDFSCAAAAAEPARTNPKITILPNTEVDAVEGDSVLRRMRYHNNKTGEQFVYEAPAGDTFGVFVFAGYDPVSELAAGLAELERGYVVTDAAKQTSTPGLFAAGDVCVKRLRQVATAVGEAAEATDGLAHLCAALREKTGIVPQRPRPASAGPADGAMGAAADGAGAAGSHAGSGGAQAGASAGSDELFDEGMRAQLDAVFSRMGAPLTLELHLDERPVSRELEGYMGELARLTERLDVARAEAGAAVQAGAPDADAGRLPFVSLLRVGGEPCGMRFHGVPGGHEFTSFVLGLYNAAGPGQPLDDATRARIAGVTGPVRLRVIVSLSCTMCPDLVQAANRIAALNPQVSVDVYDVAHFPELKSAYNVMSVPCLIVERDGAEQVTFGKKSLDQLLDLLA